MHEVFSNRTWKMASYAASACVLSVPKAYLVGRLRALASSLLAWFTLLASWASSSISSRLSSAGTSRARARTRKEQRAHSRHEGWNEKGYGQCSDSSTQSHRQCSAQPSRDLERLIFPHTSRFSSFSLALVAPSAL